VGEKKKVLKHHADVPPVGRQIAHVLAAHHYPAVGWTLKAGDDPEKCCLSRATGAEQGKELVLFDVEIDAINRLHRSEMLCNRLKR
jgi:hypothetical protein